MNATYNDIAPWHFKDMVNVFGGAAKNARTFEIKTKKQTNQLLTDEQFNAAESLQFVEIYIPKKDAPRALKLTAEASAKTNAKE